MMQISRLKHERVVRGLNQTTVAELAKLAGTPISQVKISMLERGLVPKPGEAEALGKVFNLEPRDLFAR